MHFILACRTRFSSGGRASCIRSRVAVRKGVSTAKLRARRRSTCSVFLAARISSSSEAILACRGNRQRRLFVRCEQSTHPQQLGPRWSQRFECLLARRRRVPRAGVLLVLQLCSVLLRHPRQRDHWISLSSYRSNLFFPLHSKSLSQAGGKRRILLAHGRKIVMRGGRRRGSLIDRRRRAVRRGRRCRRAERAERTPGLRLRALRCRESGRERRSGRGRRRRVGGASFGGEGAHAEIGAFEAGGIVDGVEPRVEVGGSLGLEKILTASWGDQSEDVAVLGVGLGKWVRDQLKISQPEMRRIVPHRRWRPSWRARGRRRA